MLGNGITPRALRNTGLSDHTGHGPWPPLQERCHCGRVGSADMDAEQLRGSPMIREQLVTALEASWTMATSADPSLWKACNPSRG